MITLVKLQTLFGDLAPRGMEQVFTDWEMLAGFAAKAECSPIVIASGIAEINRFMGPNHVVVETKIEKNSAGFGHIYFAFPNAMVIEIIGEMLMISESAREEKARSGLSKTDVETFQEMANLLCESWNRVFQDLDRNLRISQSVQDLRVSASIGSKSAVISRIPEGRVAWVPTKITSGDKSYTAMIVLPFGVALAVAEEFYATTDPRSATAG
ncbi:hypothetical protein Poly30_02340 [Planctomycetes bacterium Poly30]|uniref:Chemotaxis phosphatase CheX-like domain-containing protein n=1 Tax=Saltatorellus ferox TaxID=2528018 RepID=A0A518EL23_9BACT|nr:hypothetical protein Poly30_02340 [Planctomycetes bacterium Poly30]